MTVTAITKTKLDINSINTLVKKAEYAVRGPIVSRAAELTAQLKTPNHKLPFDKTISCNIGNPHSLGQKPISFVRDVLSIVVNPSLKKHAQLFPADVVLRAERYLKDIPGLGAYSESQGLASVREDVAKFLEERDGFRGDPSKIFITNGASEGVRLTMQTLLRDPSEGIQDGVLTPIPQYPLYSALTTLLKGELVPYYLDESQGWSCTVSELKRALDDARRRNICTRSLVVINPGNPTGQVLTEDDMRGVIDFCVNEGITLMADEVYQENIWKPNAKFVSFRKVANELGLKDVDDGDLKMISFHSVSKGFLGECGLRGGYFELFGIPEEVRKEIYKLASISLCSNTLGQITTGLMVQPPKPGDASHATYVAERDAILTSMKKRAVMLSNALNKVNGISCTNIDGAMYAFPSISLPAAVVQAAEKLGLKADELYCMKLLEQTGIVVVPGSGFRQKEGTFHFRTTILPPEDSMNQVVEKIAKFHTAFIAQYS